MLQITQQEYRDLVSIMYSTQHLIEYIENDVIPNNTIERLDLKYLNNRTRYISDKITNYEKNND
jgi:hypothetical protein